MNTIRAQEIKRRGISAVDDSLQDGPVHVIKNNQPRYVVMNEDQYEELISELDESYGTRVKESLEDYRRGRTRRFKTVADLMKSIEQNED